MGGIPSVMVPLSRLPTHMEEQTEGDTDSDMAEQTEDSGSSSIVADAMSPMVAQSNGTVAGFVGLGTTSATPESTISSSVDPGKPPLARSSKNRSLNFIPNPTLGTMPSMTSNGFFVGLGGTPTTTDDIRVSKSTEFGASTGGILGARPNMSISSSSPSSRSPPAKLAKHRRKGHRRARSEPIDVLMESAFDELIADDRVTSMLPSPTTRFDVYPMSSPSGFPGSMAGMSPLNSRAMIHEEPPMLANMKPISSSSPASAKSMRSSVDAEGPPKLATIAQMGSAGSFDLAEAEAFHRQMQLQIQRIRKMHGVPDTLPFVIPPIGPPMLFAASPKVANFRQRHAPKPPKKDDSTGVKGGDDDEHRGKYRCGRCGQFKVNHVCPFVVDTACRSLGIQVDPADIFSGERTILLRTDHPWMDKNMDDHGESPSDDTEQYSEEHVIISTYIPTGSPKSSAQSPSPRSLSDQQSAGSDVVIPSGTMASFLPSRAIPLVVPYQPNTVLGVTMDQLAATTKAITGQHHATFRPGTLAKTVETSNRQEKNSKDWRQGNGLLTNGAHDAPKVCADKIPASRVR